MQVLVCSTQTLSVVRQRRPPATAGARAASVLERHQQRAAQLAAGAAAAVLLGASLPQASWAAGVELGATLFTRNCAGCHTGGGNVLEPGQTLKTDGAPLVQKCICTTSHKMCIFALFFMCNEIKI